MSETKATWHIGKFLAEEAFSQMQDRNPPHLVPNVQLAFHARSIAAESDELGVTIEHYARFIPYLNSEFQVAAAYYLAKMLRDRYFQGFS